MDGGGQEEDVFPDRNQGLLDRDISGQEVVGGRLMFIRGETKKGGEMGLGIEVDDEDFFIFVRQGVGEIDGGGGFADPSLLVGHGDNSHYLLLCKGLRLFISQRVIAIIWGNRVIGVKKMEDPAVAW